MVLPLSASGQHSDIWGSVLLKVSSSCPSRCALCNGRVYNEICSASFLSVLSHFDDLIKSHHELHQYVRGRGKLVLYLHLQLKIFCFSRMQSNFSWLTLENKGIKHISVNLLLSQPLQTQVLDDDSVLQFFDFV